MAELVDAAKAALTTVLVCRGASEFESRSRYQVLRQEQGPAGRTDSERTVTKR